MESLKVTYSRLSTPHFSPRCSYVTGVIFFSEEIDFLDNGFVGNFVGVSGPELRAAMTVCEGKKRLQRRWCGSVFCLL